MLEQQPQKVVSALYRDVRKKICKCPELFRKKQCKGDLLTIRNPADAL